MRRWLAGATLLLAPAWCWAHSPIPGIGHFYSGMLHPLVVPAQLVALLALGLLVGQRGAVLRGAAITALILALPLGLALSRVAAAGGGMATDTLLLAVGACVALAVSAAQSMPRWTLLAGAAATGLLVGLGADPDGLEGSARALSLAGSWLGAAIVVAWIAVMTEFLRRDWMKIGVRVVGSWVAAAAMIVLALSWVGPRSDGQAAAKAAGRAAAGQPAR
jgi:FtsH-binding integral membrane protein